MKLKNKDCATNMCQKVAPQFKLTWCNVRTIMMIGLAIYAWIALK